MYVNKISKLIYDKEIHVNSHFQGMIKYFRKLINFIYGDHTKEKIY